MSVLVHCLDDPAEWGILELQGTLIDKEGGALDGENVGTLRINEQGKPVFVIGSHTLVGTIQTLPKPLVVIQKDPKFSGEGNCKAQWNGVAVVRKKYLFTAKPETR